VIISHDDRHVDEAGLQAGIARMEEGRLAERHAPEDA
jgi:hypothetical protein